ncbi:MAG TPA: hypothetical protein VF787_10535 [Thermoanaerobaculia bacterium]
MRGLGLLTLLVIAGALHGQEVTATTTVNGQPQAAAAVPQPQPQQQADANDGNARVQCAATLQFDRDGRLLGNPPNVVSNRNLCYEIRTAPDLADTQRAEVADLLLKAALTIHRAGELTPPFDYGLVLARKQQIRATYCAKARELVNQLGSSVKKAELEIRLGDGRCLATDTFTSGFLPDFNFGVASYRGRVACRDASPSADEQAATLDPSTGLAHVALTMPRGCREVSYELRFERPLPSAVEEWAARHPMPDDLRLKATEARRQFSEQGHAVPVATTLEKFKKVHGCVASELARQPPDESTLMTCVEKTTAADAIAAFRTATTEIGGHINRLVPIFNPLASQITANWVEKWLWLTEGQPSINPLRFARLSAAGKELETYKTDLVATNARIAATERIAAGLRISDPVKFAELQTAIAADQVKRETLTAAITKTTTEIQGLEAKLVRDSFLYDGLLFPSGGETYMQHHDAKSSFTVMGTPVAEVIETRRVIVMVENADSAAQFKIVQTVTPIASDRTQLTDELSLSRTASAAPGPTVTGAALTFKIQYEFLRAISAITESQLTGSEVPLRFGKDETPALVTKLVPHDVPGPAPAKVEYTIKRIDGTTETEVAKQSYRLNRLYRVRFRTGLMFSTLKTTEVKGEGDARKEIESEHGADAVFGIQTYIGARRDIRNLDRKAFSVFTGFGVRDFTHNALLGIGWEATAGVTLTTGIHAGRSQKKRGEGVEDQWRGRPFFAVTFDVDLFKQLLGIKPTL